MSAGPIFEFKDLLDLNDDFIDMYALDSFRHNICELNSRS